MLNKARRDRARDEHDSAVSVWRRGDPVLDRFARHRRVKVSVVKCTVRRLSVGRSVGRRISRYACVLSL